MKDMFYKLVTIKIGLFLLTFFTLMILVKPHVISAQGMMRRFNNPSPSSQSSTALDEAAGKAIFDKLQSKQVDCKSLTDDDFDVLGDYFMGQRMGASHENMNNMMKQMMGEEGEKQMHISLGKRLSGCDTSYPIPSQGSKFLPMMGMMGGNWNNNYSGGGGWSMMGGNWGSGMMGGWNSGWVLMGGIVWILVIIFLVLGIVYFWKGITGKGRK